MARERLAAATVGRLATLTVHDRPHIVPCCFVVTGGMIYSGVDGKPKSGHSLRRLENVRERGVFALLVDHYGDDWSELWWVRVDGHGRIVDDQAERAEAVQRLTAKYSQYREVGIPGPVLALDIETVTTWP